MQSWYRSHASFAFYSQTISRKRLSPVSHYLCGAREGPFSRGSPHISSSMYSHANTPGVNGMGVGWGWGGGGVGVGWVGGCQS